jgi:hypothetical protein
MTTLSPPVISSEPVDRHKPVTQDHEPPGACSGPLPPAGGHSPTRPSASAGAPLSMGESELCRGLVLASVDFDGEVRQAVKALRSWRRAGKARREGAMGSARQAFHWHFSRVMLVAAPRTSTRRQLDRACMLHRAIGRVLTEQPAMITLFPTEVA